MTESITKKCKKCGIEKQPNEFRKGNRSKCRKCMCEETKQYQREHPEKRIKYRADNKERLLAQGREHYRLNRDRILKAQNDRHRSNPDISRRGIVRAYGITIEDYNNMFASQNGVCKICGSPPKKRSLYIDHDHKTGRVRALLCHNCNAAIGHAKENTEILEKMIEYLVDYR